MKQISSRNKKDGDWTSSLFTSEDYYDRQSHETFEPIHLIESSYCSQNYGSDSNRATEVCGLEKLEN